MSPERSANLKRLLKPRSVAVIGGRDARIVIAESRRIGYRGKLYAVNPRRTSIAGVSCVASVEDLPEPPDAVFLAIPPAPAIDVVKQLANLGAGGVVCFTAGFGGAGREGGDADQTLVDAAGDLAVVGPNCYGLINYIDRVALWPFQHGGYCPGYGAAIVTQSGMLASDITMNQRSVPMAMIVSAGNQSVLRLEHYLDSLCEIDAVRVLGLHIEGLRDIPAFARAARKALALGKPIVVLKTGTSAIGSQLTVSHTGSLSGDNELYEALFKRLGIISVSSPAVFLETLKYLSVCGVPRGVRVCGITCSGGGATMLADYAERIGLSFPDYDLAQTQRLRERLPAIATVSNPLDYTTPIWGDADKTRPVFEAALSSSDTDRPVFDSTVLVQDYPADGIDDSRQFYVNDAMAFAAAAAKACLPAAVCSTLPENIDQPMRELLIEKGVAPLQGIHEGLDAILFSAQHGALRETVMQRRSDEFESQSVFNQQSLSEDMNYCDEASAKDALRLSGLNVPTGQVVFASAVVNAGRDIGFPVVLKRNSNRIQHKSEAGAVTVGLNSCSDLQTALARMLNHQSQSDRQSSQFLVEQQCHTPIAELLVSVRADAAFGWILTVATGGGLVELHGDGVTLILPAEDEEIVAAIDRLFCAPILNGYRGGPVAERRTLLAGIRSVVAFAMENKNRYCEIEINPLFVYADTVVVVDALIRKNK